MQKLFILVGRLLGVMGVTNSDGVQCGFPTLFRIRKGKKKKSHHTSTISHPPEQEDMVLVGFFYLLSPGVMMREVWPATLIIEGCVCVCVCGGSNSLSELC